LQVLLSAALTAAGSTSSPKTVGEWVTLPSLRHLAAWVARLHSLGPTVVSPTAAGFVAAYPYPGPFPGISTINVNAGEPALANGAIVPLGLDYTYELSVVYGTAGGGTTHLVIDVTGYFQDP
jgi:hypothetical protein